MKLQPYGVLALAILSAVGCGDSTGNADLHTPAIVRPSLAVFHTDPTTTVTPVPGGFVLRKELSGFGNYGVADQAADILYSTESDQWEFDMSVIPGPIVSATAVLSLVLDDHYGRPESDYVGTITLNGTQVFSGGFASDLDVPHGIPGGEVFTNWQAVNLRISKVGPPVYTVAIQNNTTGPVFGDWIAIDFIEIHVLTRAVTPLPGGPPGFTLIDLGTLGGTDAAAFDINNRGQVVGSSTVAGGQRHAFLWQDGAMADLGTLGGAFSAAFGINDRGQVVGSSTLANGQTRAFLWQDGTMTALGTLGGTRGFARDVNDRAQVVGASGLANGELHAFLWQGGIMTDLGTLGGTSSLAFGINDHGQVVGSSTLSDGESHAFLWQSGTMTDLGSLGGSVNDARSVNNVGQVVGESQLANGAFRAFFWQDGPMTVLGTLGGQHSGAVSINNRGQVVGSSWLTSGEIHAFLWQDGTMSDLGTLGGTFSSAGAINDFDQVAGFSRLATGETHAALWTRQP